jgi:hypothetical protein
VIVAYTLVCIAVGFLLAHMALIGWLPPAPLLWARERVMKAGALLYLLGITIAAVFGRKVY